MRFNYYIYNFYIAYDWRAPVINFIMWSALILHPKLNKRCIIYFVSFFVSSQSCSILCTHIGALFITLLIIPQLNEIFRHHNPLNVNSCRRFVAYTVKNEITHDIYQELCNGYRRNTYLHFHINVISLANSW